MFNNFFPPKTVPLTRLCGNIVEPDRPQTKIWHMRIAFYIPKATNTLSKYVIIIPFPLQQWLQECA